jgi:acetyl esterase/lipase
MIGDKRQQGRPLLTHLAANGLVCVAANYRLSPRATFPDHIIDVKRAIAWLRTHIADYGGDPRFIAVTGGSAGAHLAALAALTPGRRQWQPGFEEVDTSVQACVPVYGVYDFTKRDDLAATRSLDRVLRRLIMKQGLQSARALYESASPLYQIGSEAPPFLVIHGRRDTLAPVEQSRRFVTELRAVSAAPVLYLELPAAQHAFDLFPSVRAGAVLEGIRRFLVHAASASAVGQEGLRGELGPQETGLGVDHEPDGDSP